MSYNRIFYFLQNTSPRLDFICILPLAPMTEDTRKGVARLTRVRIVRRVHAEPFRESAFEPLTAFEA
jgi:hypothetical protein